jgi:hypothetical protein
MPARTSDSPKDQDFPLFSSLPERRRASFTCEGIRSFKKHYMHKTVAVSLKSKSLREEATECGRVGRRGTEFCESQVCSVQVARRG